jgi:uncharacterized OB-fold protein
VAVSPVYVKPLPQPDPVTQPFWDSVRRHAIELQRCAGCRTFIFYPRAICPSCGSGALHWEPVSGRGTLYSFTVVHRATVPEFRADVPYVVALVDLDEGPRLMATLVDVPADPARIRIGTRLEIVYDDVTPDVTLLRFRPAA